MRSIFQCKTYGPVTVDDKGELVIPQGLRETLNIKPGDRLMVFSKPDEKIISLIPLKPFEQPQSEKPV